MGLFFLAVTFGCSLTIPRKKLRSRVSIGLPEGLYSMGCFFFSTFLREPSQDPEKKFALSRLEVCSWCPYF